MFQICAASKQKCLSGLDSIANDGSLAFETLHEMRWKEAVSCCAPTSQKMRIVRATTGKLFASDQWLSEQQIAGFFSRLASARRVVTLQNHDEDEMSAADDLLLNKIVCSLKFLPN